MDETGKLIFNALASKRAVWLPQVGTFRPEYIPASDNGDGSITPPRNEIAFTPERAEDAVSITELMRHEAGGEAPAVRYERWLAKATERGPVVIEGIGVVNNGVFTPYESLLNALNPIPASVGMNTKPTASKGLSRSEKTWIVLIIIFLAILGGGWTWWHYTDGAPWGTNRGNVRNAAVTDNMDRIPEYTGSEGVPDEVAETETEPASVEVPQEVAPPVTAARPQGNAGPGFYVVGNVFTVAENADKYIAQMSKKYPDLDYVKHSYNGKTMVTLYSSTDRREANRQRIKIEDRILKFDLWLYEVK